MKKERRFSRDHGLAMRKTHQQSVNKYSPRQTVYCGIELEPSGICPRFCIYIHDGFFGLDYEISSVCPSKVFPDDKADAPILKVHEESQASYQYFSDHTTMDDHLLNKLEDKIINWLRDYGDRHCVKFQAAGIGVEEGDELVQEEGEPTYIRQKRRIGKFRLPFRLWAELDVLPFILRTNGSSIDERACSAVRKALFYVTPHLLGNIPRVSVGYRHQVEVDCDFRIHIADLKDYGNTVSNPTWRMVNTLASEVRNRGLNIMFINSTPQGGGVALMRHAVIRLLHLLGISARWYVMKPNPEVFSITKRKLHNVLQGVAPATTRLNSDDIDEYEEWCRENAERYWMSGPFKTADVVVIDDPQPCGIIKYLKEVNSKCKIIYRSHIELRSDLIRDPTTEQHRVWNFLFKSYIQKVDCFISHPVAHFVPDDVPREKLVMMPATTDPLDGLNKTLSVGDLDYYWRVFNRISFDQTGKRGAFWSRPYIVQISRFDPSKGIPDVIRAYDLFRKRVDGVLPLSKIPQLIIAGHGSVDDPDGAVVFEEILSMLQEEELSGIAHDVLIARVPPSDQMLNALLRGALVALQLSIREGFEIKVTEALAKGVPVIAYSCGGIPHQIRHGRTGFLVASGNVNEVAERLHEIILDWDDAELSTARSVSQHLATKGDMTGVATQLHSLTANRKRAIRTRLSEAAKKSLGEEYFTVFQVINWLYLWLALHDDTFTGKVAATRQWKENVRSLSSEDESTVDGKMMRLSASKFSKREFPEERGKVNNVITQHSSNMDLGKIPPTATGLNALVRDSTGCVTTMTASPTDMTIPAGFGDAESDRAVRAYEENTPKFKQVSEEKVNGISWAKEDEKEKYGKGSASGWYNIAGLYVWVKEMWQNDPAYAWWREGESVVSTS